MTTTTLTDAELLRLEELAAKATPGEWYESVTGEGVPSVNASAEDAYHGFSVCIQGMIYNTYNTPYIAASCNAAPSLVAEVRALRRHNQAMRGGNKFVRDSLQAENAALRERVEALEKWETSASCCVICNNSPADKITLHETDAPWEIYAPFEVCLCREHQRALIAGVQEAVKKMKEEREVANG